MILLKMSDQNGVSMIVIPITNVLILYISSFKYIKYSTRVIITKDFTWTEQTIRLLTILILAMFLLLRTAPFRRYFIYIYTKY